jgi:anthranilate synthase/aminodeoxychorismate synthase-like glutamine amidotransferase
MIVLVDNYDSFVFNLARYFERLGQTTRVVRNDALDAGQIEAMSPDAVVLSPGPCTPSEAGCSLDVVRRLGGKLPILGVCLGHQAIAAALGGRVMRAAEPVHGRTSQVFHDGRSVFKGLSDPFVACRYHSLVVERDTLPDCLEIIAWTADNEIMAIEHRELPIVGLQFHPESILTDSGYEMLSAFLRMAGVEVPGEIPTMASECAQPKILSLLPDVPVTF